MKTALTARLQSTSHWIDVLPTVLLGLRAAVRSDTGVSAAQLTFGRNLRLPGDFFVESPCDVTMDHNYVTKIKESINALKPSSSLPPHNNKRAIFVHPALRDCQQVFLRVDAVKKPLQPPYDGPYRVLRKKDKVFVLQLPDRQATVSIDRLKPAFTPADCTTDTVTAPAITKAPQSPARETTTRSGRAVRPPVRFA
ncbi:uncharacterized protein LOC113233542 [Hyposmocoma kahamanoa]|uniref:uncharacterized protein LOC113233542 n=1 Tax=Hyposmocoma kahamanoa TaxID=1477025 RepID=UPI000E6D67D4|nr:uncharacterized protein LOC113233542 [Hyposmocoma kahamanoa]